MPSTYTNLLYHIIFSTKGRTPTIAENFQEELYRYIGGIIRAEGGVQLEIGGTDDHAHILAKFRSAISVSEMLNRIKSNSSKWLNEKHMRTGRFGWQEGYAAFTVSESQVPAVREYIQNQKTHHHKRTFQEELTAMLQKNGVDYDPRYLWD